MTRPILTALAIGVTMMAAWFVLTDPSAWPLLLFAGLLLLGTVFEQVRYRGAKGRREGGKWRATSERFIDDASGRMVTVWFNATTGDRRYVEEGEAPPQ